MSEAGAQRVGVLDVVAFACEIAMLVLLAVAGWSLANSTVVQVVLAALLPVAAAVIWGVAMAPKSSRRLPNPARLVAQTALFAVTGALVAFAGHPWWGLVFAVVATATFAARSRTPD
ncbi:MULTISPECIES: YrdB family protein [Rhodococcus]|uniref:YrdB family protein n=1 Tax=Rhodococcus pseudokoreensis TaxID=2811421 RepID=A0A974ZWE0_9NOCA|nr:MULTISPECIES: YrdB family protein [Rhodococcus]MBV6762340.1 YrdB family protein [Rhodococcus opacus]QSE92946.1 YrdB family protein [Rhodococcus pseudokoreensis]